MGVISRFARPSLNTNADLPSDGMHGNRIHMTAALYRAVVETYAAVSAGKRIVPLSTYHASTLFNETKDVKIELTVAGDPEGEGAIRLQYRNAEAEQKVLATGRAAANVPSARVPDLSTADEIIKSWGRAWLHISLDDPQVKLGVSHITSLKAQIASDIPPDHQASHIPNRPTSPRPHHQRIEKHIHSPQPYCTPRPAQECLRSSEDNTGAGQTFEGLQTNTQKPRTVAHEATKRQYQRQATDCEGQGDADWEI